MKAPISPTLTGLVIIITVSLSLPGFLMSGASASASASEAEIFANKQAKLVLSTLNGFHMTKCSKIPSFITLRCKGACVV
ncbi:hypothetical protein V6N13_149336 [Hibiscus sabdariffa]